MTALRAAITAAVKGISVADVTKAAVAIEAKLVAIGGAAPTGGRRGGGAGFRGGGPTGPPTFASLSGGLTRDLATFDPGDMAPTEPQIAASKAALEGLRAVEAAWKSFLEKDLVTFNALLVKNGGTPVKL